MVWTTIGKVNRSRTITLRGEDVKINDIATRVCRHKTTVLRALAATTGRAENEVPQSKLHPGKQRKTSKRTIALIRHTVTKDPFITSSKIMKGYPQLLQNVSQHTIHDHLHRYVNLSAPLAKLHQNLIMKHKRLEFCSRYTNWTPEQWKNVFFSNESTFRGVSRSVQCSPKRNWFDEPYTMKSVKHTFGDSLACF